MKIIRHTARDMRTAMRAVREQLGDDAVILSSRRTGEGVEITAAIDFDASTLEAGGFANTPLEPPPVIDASFVTAPAATMPGAGAPGSSRAPTSALSQTTVPSAAPRALAVATHAASAVALNATQARQASADGANAR